MRKLKRNDIVSFNGDSCMVIYGRVWRRIDANHVQVIDCGKSVRIYHENQLTLEDYKGYWMVPQWWKPSGWSKFVPMTSLRQLKKIARHYNAHFGGCDAWGNRWSKVERKEALANREKYVDTRQISC